MHTWPIITSVCRFPELRRKKKRRSECHALNNTNMHMKQALSRRAHMWET